jgi:hypothetical protein
MSRYSFFNILVFCLGSAMVVNHQSIRAKCDDSSRNGSPRCLSLLEAGSSDQLTAVSTFYGECSATKCEAVKPLPRSSSNIPHWLQHCRDQLVNIPVTFYLLC